MSTSVQDNGSNFGESGDELDDTSSVGSGCASNADNSRSGTPTLKKRGKQKRGRKKVAPLLPLKCGYKFSAYMREDHGQPIFGVQFNHLLKDGPSIFAVASSNRVTIYECLDNGYFKMLQCYGDPDPDENYYTVAWSYDTETGNPILAAAGSRGVIRIYSPASYTCTKNFTGHGNAVNELKFHPKDPNMLLSVSKDHGLRLWNIRTDILVALFGGVEAHRDEVLSADINMYGEYIVSCGMDHSLKVWSLKTDAMKKAMKDSYTFNPSKAVRPFPTLEQHFPDFSTRDIHRNYVDCVKWLGRFILSKSCENSIVCWKPGLLAQSEIKKGDTNVTIIHKFDYKECEIWFIRFSLDYFSNVMAVGNQQGKIYVWDIGVDDIGNVRCSTLAHPKCVAPIRQTSFSRDGKILIAVADDATIWRWDVSS